VPAQSFVIRPRGPFSLTESATFGFGQRDESQFDGVMRLAFGVDGYAGQAGVELRQDDGGAVRAVVHGGASDLAAVQRQVERFLSLDHDGDEFLLDDPGGDELVALGEGAVRVDLDGAARGVGAGPAGVMLMADTPARGSAIIWRAAPAGMTRVSPGVTVTAPPSSCTVAAPLTTVHTCSVS
jgi:hypothetical protein